MTVYTCKDSFEGILTGVYDLDDLADKRLEWGLFRDRRPEMYIKITQ